MLQKFILPEMTFSSIDPKTLAANRNNWALMIALSIGLALAALVNLKHTGPRLAKTLNTGDTLPHNGAVITLLAISGMTHRQSYLEIFALTVLKSLTVFLLIGFWGVFT